MMMMTMLMMYDDDNILITLRSCNISGRQGNLLWSSCELFSLTATRASITFTPLVIIMMMMMMIMMMMMMTMVGYLKIL